MKPPLTRGAVLAAAVRDFLGILAYVAWTGDRARGMRIDVNISGVLNSFQRGYDRRVRPNYGGDAVDVGITMHVLSISDFSEVQMFWKDPRLVFEAKPGLETLSVGSEFIQKIWVPDTFFANEKKSYFHTHTTNNEFLRINHDGSIVRSMRLTITAACPMNFEYFPMDSPVCNIEIESFGYTMKDIRYKWNEGEKSIRISSEVSLPQFKVLGYKQKTKVVSLTTGVYSRLACEIQFVRSMGYYFIQIYIPSSLIVVISWVSFWLNRNASPARVYLGVTTVLTMTTLMSSTNSSLPKVSYIKSIDIYLGACFVMVFASLIEYASVGYVAKRILMRKTKKALLRRLSEERKRSCCLRKMSHVAPPCGPLRAPGRPPQPILRHLPPGATSLDDEEGALFDPCSPTPSCLRSFDDSEAAALVACAESRRRDEDQARTRRPRIPGNGTPPNCKVMQSSRRTENDVFLQCLEDRECPFPGFCSSRSGACGYEDSFPTDDEFPVFVARHPRSRGAAEPVVVAAAAAARLPLAPGSPPPAVTTGDRVCGLTSSDIDKYSRVVFPVCFVCFNLTYWVVYLHVSDVIADDLVLLEEA